MFPAVPTGLCPSERHTPAVAGTTWKAGSSCCRLFGLDLPVHQETTKEDGAAAPRPLFGVAATGRGG